MRSPRTAKLLSGYSAGLLTATEVGSAILLDLLARTDAEPPLRAAVAELPSEVRERLFDLLRDIQTAGYHWKPFWLGPGGEKGASDFDPINLQRVCAELGVV